MIVLNLININKLFGKQNQWDALALRHCFFIVFSLTHIGCCTSNLAVKNTQQKKLYSFDSVSAKWHYAHHSPLDWPVMVTQPAQITEGVWSGDLLSVGKKYHLKFKFTIDSADQFLDKKNVSATILFSKYEEEISKKSTFDSFNISGYIASDSIILQDIPFVIDGLAYIQFQGKCFARYDSTFYIDKGWPKYFISGVLKVNLSSPWILESGIFLIKKETISLLNKTN